MVYMFNTCTCTNICGLTINVFSCISTCLPFDDQTYLRFNWYLCKSRYGYMLTCMLFKLVLISYKSDFVFFWSLLSRKIKEMYFNSLKKKTETWIPKFTKSNLILLL